MFSGIIEEVGSVIEIVELSEARELVIGADSVLADLEPGSSISVDGACQTVVALESQSFRVQAIASTLSRTTLGELEPGRAVNLERPLVIGDRVGGHLVQGHVDGVGVVTSVEREAEMVLVGLALPETVAPYVILHGSLALDGVSLTVNGLAGDGTAQVALIPYTYAQTNLCRLAPGSRVNLEADLIGKHVARAVEAYRQGFRGSSEAR